MKLIYLEAGSGADNSVPNELIKAIKSIVETPLIVGGGIKNPENAHEKANSGAEIIVTGNILEDTPPTKIKGLISDFVRAIHKK
jgi:geranylgeranylglyceryl phosphate synthase family protein